MVCVRILIKGVVQGLGYLGYIYIVANKLGVRGWAKYLDIKTIEVVAVGSNDVVDQFIDLLKYHDTFAIISEVVVEACPKDLVNINRFEILS